MTLVTVLDIIGTFVFAISGIRLAAKKDMDLFGAAVIGFVTAIGGGTTRDILLGSQPVTWLVDPLYPAVILIAVPFTYLMRERLINYERPLFVFDTIGIALFTIIGMQKALDMGINPVMAGTMGMTSAVVGGVIRDILCREVPLIFRKEIYATACLIGAAIYYAGIQLDVDTELNYIITTAVIIGIRIAAVKLKWSLPKMKG